MFEKLLTSLLKREPKGRERVGEKQLMLDQMAELLQTTPEAMQAFEAAYALQSIEENPDNFFDLNAKQAKSMSQTVEAGIEPERMAEEMLEQLNALVRRIVVELVAQTPVMVYENGQFSVQIPKALADENIIVKKEELMQIPESIRPQLAGTLIKKELNGDSYPVLLFYYDKYLHDKNPVRSQEWYHHFRQGLDLLDLDPIMYEMIATNPTSMGYWFPALVKACEKQSFFKIPETRIVKVPISLLQLTRLDYLELTDSTRRIVDEWASEVFELKEEREYFVKTGCYSSKYDFRNAHVHGAKEVRELGEYLLFIHHQALMMAGPLVQPKSIYGASTTVEWVVREYIKDKEANKQIYHGMPLHTEYRLFVGIIGTKNTKGTKGPQGTKNLNPPQKVDFSENQDRTENSKCENNVDFSSSEEENRNYIRKGEVLGIVPYWEPETMKKRFSEGSTVHDKHDYVIYKSHEETLMRRYNENKDKVVAAMEELIQNLDLDGQWSIDVMQNGDDFWIIDMHPAENSAFYDKVVPPGKRRPMKENWMPKLPEAKN